MNLPQNMAAPFQNAKTKHKHKRVSIFLSLRERGRTTNYALFLSYLYLAIIERFVPLHRKFEGIMAEWLGRGLQNLVQRFESA